MPSFSKNINIISRCAHAYRSASLEESGLGASHYFYILLICAHPGMSQEQIAKHLYLNKSSVTRAIAALEENGFAERRASEEDKRVTMVFPTQKAEDILPEVRASAHAWNDFLLEELGEEEKTAFLSTLEKVTARAKSYIDLELTPKELQKNETTN
jgi:DNA-binding MarR family transcriptional regulator